MSGREIVIPHICECGLQNTWTDFLSLTAQDMLGKAVVSLSDEGLAAHVTDLYTQLYSRLSAPTLST